MKPPSTGTHSTSHIPRQTLLCILLASIICAQAVNILVSPDYMETLDPPSVDGGRADWNHREIMQLLEFLKTHKSQIGEAGTFKQKTYTPLLPTLAPLRTSGPIKTVKHCAYKWSAVSSFFFLIRSHR